MGMTSVRMPDDLLNRLEQTAESLQRSKGWVIKDAVKEYIEREELKQLRNKQTLEALDDLDNGRVIDGGEVMAWLDSWGEESEKEPPLK